MINGAFYMVDNNTESVNERYYAMETIGGESEFYETLSSMNCDGYNPISTLVFEKNGDIYISIESKNPETNQSKFLFCFDQYTKEFDNRDFDGLLFDSDYDGCIVEQFESEGGFNYCAYIYDKVKLPEFVNDKDFQRFIVVTQNGDGFCDIQSFGDLDLAKSVCIEFTGLNYETN